MSAKKIPTKLPILFTWEVQTRVTKTRWRFWLLPFSVEQVVTDSHSLTITADGVQFNSRWIPWAELTGINCLYSNGIMDLKIMKVDHKLKVAWTAEHLHIPIGPPLKSDYVARVIQATQKRHFKAPDFTGYRYLR